MLFYRLVCKHIARVRPLRLQTHFRIIFRFCCLTLIIVLHKLIVEFVKCMRKVLTSLWYELWEEFLLRDHASKALDGRMTSLSPLYYTTPRSCNPPTLAFLVEFLNGHWRIWRIWRTWNFLLCFFFKITTINHYYLDFHHRFPHDEKIKQNEFLCLKIVDSLTNRFVLTLKFLSDSKGTLIG